MKKIVSMMLIFTMLLTLAACGNTAQTSGNQEPAVTTEFDTTTGETMSEDIEATSDSAQESDTKEETAERTAESGSHILVAYFSLAGEQYNVGVIDESRPVLY